MYVGKASHLVVERGESAIAAPQHWNLVVKQSDLYETASATNTGRARKATKFSADHMAFPSYFCRLRCEDADTTKNGLT